MSDSESHADNEKVMAKVSAQFIHDIATPLAVIQILASTLETYLPDLLAAHEELKNLGKETIDISSEDYDLIKGSATRIKALTQQVNKEVKEYWQKIESQKSATDFSDTQTPKLIKSVSLQNKLNILVVEDDAIHQKIAYKLLSNQHHVDLAANGQEAIELCRKKTYDLILMDLHMPVMGGEQAVAHITKQEKFSAVIIGLTNRPLGSERNQLLQQGFRGFIEKPLNLGELKKLIEELVN